jgi:hypothetical protein
MIVRQLPRWLNWATAILDLLAFAYLVGGCHDLVTDQTFQGTFQYIQSFWKQQEITQLSSIA